MHLLPKEDAVDPLKELLKQIDLKEAEFFNTVFARFCLIHGVKIDIRYVQHTEPKPDRLNYWEYWYQRNGVRKFLMSRELIYINDIPTLECLPAKELE